MPMPMKTPKAGKAMALPMRPKRRKKKPMMAKPPMPKDDMAMLEKSVADFEARHGDMPV